MEWMTMSEFLNAVGKAVKSLNFEEFTDFIAALTRIYICQYQEGAVQDDLLAAVTTEQILQYDEQVDGIIQSQFSDLGEMLVEHNPPSEVASYVQAWVLWVATGYFLRKQIKRLKPIFTKRIRDFFETQDRLEVELSEAVLKVVREIRR